MASTIVDGPSSKLLKGSAPGWAFGQPVAEEVEAILVLTSQYRDVAAVVEAATRTAAQSHGLVVDASACPYDLDDRLSVAALTVVDLTSVDVPFLTTCGVRRLSRIPDPDALIRAGVALGALGREGVLGVRDVSRGGLSRLPMLDVVEVDMEAGASAVVGALTTAVSRRLARIESDAGSGTYGCPRPV